VGSARGASLDDIVLDLIAADEAGGEQYGDNDLIAGDARPNDESAGPAGHRDTCPGQAPHDPSRDSRPEKALPGQTVTGTVVHSGHGRCLVMSGGRHLDCVVPPAMAATRDGGPVAGDEAAVEIVDDAAGQGRLRGLFPRRTLLSRTDPQSGHRLLTVAANVDVAVIVVPLAKPGVKPRLIDRYLVAAARGGLDAVVCAAKLDLVAPGERQTAEQPLAAYRSLGIPVVAASSVSGEGLDELRAVLAGRSCVLVGHSGVGKTSLLNALAPQLDLATADVRAIDGRGRHTTTASSLHELPGGIRVIDTPGIRQLGLGEVTASELAAAFADIAAQARNCRFRDCSHTHEPDCGVKAAVDDGRLPWARYDSYLRLAAAHTPERA
jgi:ribosome biogenesis GTPase